MGELKGNEKSISQKDQKIWSVIDKKSLSVNVSNVNGGRVTVAIKPNKIGKEQFWANSFNSFKLRKALVIIDPEWPLAIQIEKFPYV